MPKPINLIAGFYVYPPEKRIYLDMYSSKSGLTLTSRIYSDKYYKQLNELFKALKRNNIKSKISLNLKNETKIFRRLHISIFDFDEYKKFKKIINKYNADDYEDIIVRYKIIKLFKSESMVIRIKETYSQNIQIIYLYRAKKDLGCNVYSYNNSASKYLFLKGITYEQTNTSYSIVKPDNKEQIINMIKFFNKEFLPIGVEDFLTRVKI